MPDIHLNGGMVQQSRRAALSTKARVYRDLSLFSRPRVTDHQLVDLLVLIEFDLGYQRTTQRAIAA